MQEWSVPVGLAVGVLAAVVLTLVTLAAVVVVVLRRSRARSERALADARAEAAALRARIDDIERRLSAPTVGDDQEFVITRLGDEAVVEPPPGPAAVPGQLFADLVLRESVVQAGSFAAGLRRALAPEVRNRIRFEMRREVKRSRKQRRTDLRQARREWAARQRADEAPEAAGEGAENTEDTEDTAA